METVGKQSEMIDWSLNLLRAMKENAPTEEWLSKLGGLEVGQVIRELDTDAKKLAFWINIYNAGFLYLRKVMRMDRPEIYVKKVICLAGEVFSLDDIEHGILRKYRWKFSLGYLPSIRVRRIIRLFSVEKIDYRIHFALNCGARSCPPIEFYRPGDVYDKLDRATRSFIQQETKILHAQKEIWVSRLFLWYKGDFGGKRAIMRLLEKHFEMDLRRYKLKFKPYDWTEELDRFV